MHVQVKSKRMTAPFRPSEYKISTITATGGVNTHINLDVFYNNVEVSDAQSISPTKFVYIEFGTKKSDTYFRGFNKKLNVSRRKKTESKRFDNQATVIIRYIVNNIEYHVNMKVFKNGNVQITGLKHIEQGKEVIDILIEEIKRIYKTHPTIVDNIEDLKNINYCIRLINSDFRIGFEIKRDKLYKLLQTKYNIFASYEPCIYPGVKVQYYWKQDQEETHKGICRCSKPCSGKNVTTDKDQCKKITIAIFQSGCIIITGAQSHEQISSAYDFICRVVKTNLDTIKKTPINIPSN